MNVIEAELEKIFLRIYNLGEVNGAERVLAEQGKLSQFVRRTEAVAVIGSATYRKAKKIGLLKERKQNPDKRNSPVVVPRRQFNYVKGIKDRIHATNPSKLLKELKQIEKEEL